jgi:hypothetical protein
MSRNQLGIVTDKREDYLARETRWHTLNDEEQKCLRRAMSETVFEHPANDSALRAVVAVAITRILETREAGMLERARMESVVAAAERIATRLPMPVRSNAEPV